MAPFSHLLTDKVWVADEIDRDTYGDSVFGPARQISAAHGHSLQRVVTIDGTERISGMQLDTAEEIPSTSRVWMPGEDPDVDKGRLPMSVRNEPSRRSGIKLYVTFF